VSHAPAEGLGDGEDPAHWGFAALRELLDDYSPQYLIHGHVHMSYDHRVPRVQEYGSTKIINAYERYVLDIPDASCSAKELGNLIWKTPHKQ